MIKVEVVLDWNDDRVYLFLKQLLTKAKIGNKSLKKDKSS